MINDNLRIIEGNVAEYNAFPVFSPSHEKKYFLPGRYRNQREQIIITDKLLTMGLLFLGDAGQGKTNTMLSLTGQILENMEENDLAVIFDLKGDYQEAFYEDGDLILNALDDKYAWNIFEELLPFLDNEYLFDMRIKELCKYLYKGRESEQQPFFVNAAREITEYVIRYFLYEYKETGDDSRLNNLCLKNFFKGIDCEEEDLYDSYRKVLLSYESFKGGLSYLPPKEMEDKSAYGVISEITSMANDVFAGAYGTAKNEKNAYISASEIARNLKTNVVFLSYDPSLPESQSYVFRFFVDNIIASRCSYYKEKGPAKVGKTYLFLDEFSQMFKLDYVLLALNQLRSMNFCIVAGLQHVEQMNVRYTEAEASVMLSAFQSIIAFKCTGNSIVQIQKQTGEARVSDRYTIAGGSIAYSPPYDRKCIEEKEVLNLKIGEAFVKLAGYMPFKFRFARNVVEKG